jgi:hypothetical protein
MMPARLERENRLKSAESTVQEMAVAITTSSTRMGV